MNSEAEIIEEELVYGARRRELMWQKLGLTGMAFGMAGCLAAALVALFDVDPPPMIVPFDSATGMALPNAIVEAVSLTERPAIIEAQVYRYVIDRETYNQLDNDVRVRRVLDQSDGYGRRAELLFRWFRELLKGRSGWNNCHGASWP